LSAHDQAALSLGNPLKEGSRMSFFCPYCNTENGLGYEWEGMNLPCAACLRPIELKYRLGQSIHSSAYAITFRDFCRLVNDKDTIQTAHPLLARLLDCTVVPFSGRFVLKQPDGALIPLEAAHLHSQSDPVNQRALYGLAMDLWR
jgi:hypothetical protein